MPTTEHHTLVRILDRAKKANRPKSEKNRSDFGSPNSLDRFSYKGGINILYKTV